MTTITCPECNGAGSHGCPGGYPETCDECGGSGRVECEACDGGGTIDVPTTQDDLDELGIPADASELEHRP